MSDVLSVHCLHVGHSPTTYTYMYTVCTCSRVDSPIARFKVSSFAKIPSNPRCEQRCTELCSTKFRSDEFSNPARGLSSDFDKNFDNHEKRYRLEAAA